MVGHRFERLVLRAGGYNRFFVFAATGVLLTLAGVVYLPYLGNPLLFDDFPLFDGGRIYDFASELWQNQPRWISYATLAHVHMLTDANLAANRVGNLLLHAGNAFAVFVLIKQLVKATQSAAADTSSRSVHQWIALLAAALFAVHPIAVYGVGYLVQRSIEMSTLFMLLMLIVWTRWLVGERTSWGWAVFWYACSVLSKEHSVAAPAVALLLALTLHKPSFALVRRLAVPMIAMAVVAIQITMMVKGVIGVAYEPHGAAILNDLTGAGSETQRLVYPLSILTQMHLFFKYLFLWCFPDVGRMAVDMREPFAASMTQWPYWASACAYAGYGLLAVGLAIQGGRRGLVGWLLAYPWLMFATELTTVRVQEPFVLYRAYLWFPLFAAVIVIALARVSLRFAVTSVAVSICVLIPLSWNRLTSLSDMLIAWNDAARLVRDERSFGAMRIYYNRAVALAAKDRRIEALAELDRVVAIKHDFAPIRFARGRLHYELKRYPEALADLNAAIQIDPKERSAYYMRGLTLKSLNREDEANADLAKSCELKDPMACFVLKRGEAKKLQTSR